MSASFLQYGTIIVFLLQIAFFVIIKFNDVAHLHKEVQRLDVDIKANCVDIKAAGATSVQVLERLSRIEGMLSLLVENKMVNKCKRPKKK